MLPLFCPEATLRSRDGKSLTSGHPVVATSHTHFQCQCPSRDLKNPLPFLSGSLVALVAQLQADECSQGQKAQCPDTAENRYRGGGCLLFSLPLVLSEIYPAAEKDKATVQAMLPCHQ